MKFIVGVDGGNTKTDYLVYDLEGNFIDGLRSGTCSHEAKGLGFSGAYLVMKENIDLLLSRNNLTIDNCMGACFGLAGVDVPFQKKALEEAVEKIGFKHYIVVNDGFLGIKAASPTSTGVCSINGTGTVNVGIDELGNIMQVGGIGYLSGDEAGGSFLARRTIQAVFDANFRFGKDTLLVDDVFRMYEIEHKMHLTDALLQKPVDSTYLIKSLFKRANEDDCVAIEILETAGANMARSTAGVIAHLELNEPVHIIQAGSVWAKATSPHMNEAFKKTVTSLTNKKCNFIILSEPPVMGAILWAYEIANGAVATKKIKDKILKSIKEYQNKN